MAYAHWMLIHRMLTGAGVERVQANMDIDSMSRAAFICTFADGGSVRRVACGIGQEVVQHLHERRQRRLDCVVFSPSGGSRDSWSVYLRNSPLRRSIIRFRRAS